MKRGDFDLWTAPPMTRLQRFEQVTAYARAERLPWRRTKSGLLQDLRSLEGRSVPERTRSSPLRESSYVPRRVYRAALTQRFQDELVTASIEKLKREAPDASAFRLLTASQKAVAAALVLTLAVCFAAAPLMTLITINILVTAYFLAAIFFRLYLTMISYGPEERRPPPPAVADEALPVVTILLPVYDEARCLASLAAALDALDYPQDKLDIKLLLEADDDATIAEARRLGLDRRFDCILIPPSQPRTKPKACNHALYLARGDLVVIYDAEDAPEPDQLRKAAAAFAAGDERLACVQARLNYYNADENWLTRLFAIEYALWFDSLLPALERMAIPIPLGGTSNFFRTKILQNIGGWDPFNVTEDADIGFRLARRGYRTEMLASTTYEEAVGDVKSWLRQRSRWMKGHMQTWFVHMRRPAEFFRVAGWRGLLATQIFIAGNFLSALINPLLWTVFLWWTFTRTETISAVFPGPLLALNLFALLFGNGFFIYLGVIAPLKRGWSALSPHALLAPLYWQLASLAAYRALWQLLTRPSYWEKTNHFLSAASQERLAETSQTDKKAA